jgi:hypothetical protein
MSEIFMISSLFSSPAALPFDVLVAACDEDFVFGTLKVAVGPKGHIGTELPVERIVVRPGTSGTNKCLQLMRLQQLPPGQWSRPQKQGRDLLALVNPPFASLRFSFIGVNLDSLIGIWSFSVRKLF